MLELNEIIAVFGSARRNGNTGKLIDLIGKEIGVDVIDLSDKNLSPFDYEHKNIDDDFIPLMNQLLGYNKVFFVSPVYWYAPSAQMKTFIDRTSDLLDVEELKDIGRKLRDKTAYIVCTSINEDADSSFVNCLKDTFRYLGMNYGGCIHANCENGFNPMDHKDDVSRFISSVQFSKNV